MKKRPLTIAFHTNQICMQGTEIALFDYAHFSEKMLGHNAIIVSKNNKLDAKGGAKKNQPLALEKFKSRFDLQLYNDKSEIEDILEKNNVDIFYAIKKGVRDGIESKKIKTCIHTVFKYNEPHGQVYAYVSKWLSDTMTQGQAPYVPHMIHMPTVKGNLRKELGIPEDAVVLGRYGGTNSFDVPFAPEVLLRLARSHSNLHFIFMNTDDFLNPDQTLLKKLKLLFKRESHPQIHFLPGTTSMDFKSRFINTCDGMIHARLRGETFGIAIGEFSVNNLPIITYDGQAQPDFESNHIEILGKKGLRYTNPEELERIILNFVKNKFEISKSNWDAYSKDFSPESVMEKFNDVFLR